jgi:hypothetical protein
MMSFTIREMHPMTEATQAIKQVIEDTNSYK